MNIWGNITTGSSKSKQEITQSFSPMIACWAIGQRVEDLQGGIQSQGET